MENHNLLHKFIVIWEKITISNYINPLNVRKKLTKTIKKILVMIKNKLLNKLRKLSQQSFLML